MTHVLQVLGFPPDRIGGTEMYVVELARELAKLGVTSTLVAPQEDERAITEYAGLPVQTYPVNAVPTADEMSRGLPHEGFEAFRELLARRPGTIYHQHSWTRGCGAHHLHAAKSMGLTTVLTMHVAGNLCMRGDMMLFGAAACDGKIQPATCAACWSQGRGISKPLSQALSRVPPSLSRAARHHGGRLATAVSAYALAEEKQLAALQMSEDCDHIVAVADWVLDALLANGAPAEKVSLNRQGLAEEFLASTAARPPRANGGDILELLYLGSWNPLKGIDVAVRAVMSLPQDVAVRLSIHAPSGGPEEQACERRVRELARGDARIEFRAAVERASLVQTMARFDALVVPSICLETGPLVVLEARAAGLFVVGSRLGGIAENLRDDVGSLLVEAGDVAAWAQAFRRLAAERRSGALPKSRGAVRGMATVAREMADHYQRLAT